MADYIDRQEAIKALCKAGCDSGHCGVSCDDVKAIEDLPSADVQPVRHGVWVEENSRPKSAIFYCSECHGTAYDIQPTRDKAWVKQCRYAYCPNCGARMDGE